MIVSAKVCECGYLARCKNTRIRDDGTVTRRYQCTNCEQRWTTCEVRVDAKQCGGKGNSAAQQLIKKIEAGSAIRYLKGQLEALKKV